MDKKGGGGGISNCHNLVIDNLKSKEKNRPLMTLMTLMTLIALIIGDEKDENSTHKRHKVTQRVVIKRQAHTEKNRSHGA